MQIFRAGREVVSQADSLPLFKRGMLFSRVINTPLARHYA